MRLARRICRFSYQSDTNSSTQNVVPAGSVSSHVKYAPARSPTNDQSQPSCMKLLWNAPSPGSFLSTPILWGTFGQSDFVFWFGKSGFEVGRGCLPRLLCTWSWSSRGYRGNYLRINRTPHILVGLSHGPNSGTAGESALQKIDYSDAPACGEGFPGRQPKDRDGLQFVPWDVPSHPL